MISNQTPDFIHLVVKTSEEFENEMKKLKPVYKKNTSITIWVSWYKKSAKSPTDVIRNYALKNGLADVKVCGAVMCGAV